MMNCSVKKESPLPQKAHPKPHIWIVSFNSKKK